MRIHDKNDAADVETLNEFLVNEMTAVETYNQCIAKVSDDSIVRHLKNLQNSHAARVRSLRERIQVLGGKPAESTGVWGGFAKLMEGGAKLLSEKSALSMLEEGEDKGLHDYRQDVDNLSEKNKTFVVASILPEQQRSHDHLRELIS